MIYAVLIVVLLIFIDVYVLEDPLIRSKDFDQVKMWYTDSKNWLTNLF